MKNKENLFTLLLSKFLPYWPLLLGMVLLGILAASLYLGFTTPKFESSTAVIINDEQKGAEESQLMESINVFESKKIVENEIEVLRSKAVIKDVVNDLKLYAPVYQRGFWSDKEIYTTSPVVVELRNVDDLKLNKEENKINFKYDKNNSKIIIADKSYPLNSWIKNPLDESEVKFIDQASNADFADQNLFYILNDPRSVMSKILNDLFVGAVSKSSTVVRLNYLDEIPERGKDVLNGIIKAYQRMSLIDQNTLAANTLDYVEKRMDTVGQQLQTIEKELEKYRSAEGVIDLSEQGNLYLKNVGDYDRRIADIDLQLSVLQKVERYVVSKNKNSGIVPSTLGVDDPILSQLLQRLYDAEIEYEELRKTTAENNPILVAVSNRIEQIRPGILENVRSQKSNLQASRSSLATNSGKYNDALDILPEQERKFVEISRRKKSVSDLYDYLVKKREETALSYAPSSGNIRVIEEAEASSKPVSPVKSIAYLISILFFTGLGILWITGAELLNSKVLFRSEVEDYTTLPVLGEFAYLNNEEDDRLISKHKDIFVTDQFRQVLSQLGVYDSNKSNTILVTSSIAGEGKSYVSSNLALTSALSGKKTALVDFDLRKAGATEVFNLSHRKGLSNLLSSKATYESIAVNYADELTVFPAGKKAMNSLELITSDHMKNFITILKQKFDCIIIDSPPITLVTDASLLAKYCDKTIITIRHDFTPKFLVKRIDQNVVKKGFPTSSIVFNGVKPRGMLKQNYGYGYGYGYEPTTTHKQNSIYDILKGKYAQLKN